MFAKQAPTRVIIETTGSDNVANVVDVGGVTTTLTVPQVLAGIMTSQPATAIVLIFPSAYDLIGGDYDKAYVGYGKQLYLRNDGTEVITLVPGAGGSLSGDGSIHASSYAARFYFRLINVIPGQEAYQLIRT
ncbi:MAG: hypothetical protein ACMG6E_01945 [Candidatus Roizmanbacteria bacterium]